jgi:hypothetical protein
LTEINFYPSREWNFGFHPCGTNTPCECCKSHALFTNVCPGSHATKVKFLINQRITVKFLINQRITCQNVNAVYAIYCHKCECTVYVGETRNSIRARVLAHIGDINRGTDTPVMRHFKQDNHSLQNFAFIGLWTRPLKGQRSHEVRQTQEARLIDMLQTITPHGINEQTSLINKPAIPLILPHCEQSNHLVSRIRKCVSQHTDGVPVMPAYTRGKNLKRILCRTALPPLENT